MKKLYVNAPGFDDVGDVLRGLDLPFASLEGRSLPDPANSVVFLNCGGEVETDALLLRRFVDHGGTLYASDLQANLMAETFGEVFEAQWGDDDGSTRAQVTDPGLRDVLGDSLDIEFDLSPWEYLTPTGPASEVTTFIASGGRPLVVGYTSRNLGSVLFTAFHNNHQDSRKAKELLRFLIFRPVMGREIASAREQAATRRLRVEKTWAAAFSPGSKLKYPLPAASAMTVNLSWMLPGTVRLVARDAHGLEIGVQSGSASPVELSLDQLAPGATVTLECVQTDALENPFSLQVAVAEGPVPGPFCPACGHAPKVGAAFCGRCGRRR